MFTERFLRVPVYQINRTNEEVTGKDGEMVPCIMKINPRRIESYNEAIPRKDFRPDNKIWTSVHMESGDSFLIRMKMEKFEKLLNESIK